jgi:hypothetical protein
MSILTARPPTLQSTLPERGKPILSDAEILATCERARKELYTAVDAIVEPDDLVRRSRLYMAVNAVLPELPMGGIGIEHAKEQLRTLLQDPNLTKTDPTKGKWNPLWDAMQKRKV